MRVKRLDILRCVAVILVLVYHGEIVPIINRMGWVGVDLFFVLSGFLISGLFYSEFRRRGDISLRRFFIRRGLKIYPAFYVMLLVTFVARQIVSLPNRPGRYLPEILFIQNYSMGIWQHTWSLGVEEHFYIFLPLLFLVMMKLSGDRMNPFKSLPWNFAFIASCCLFLRGATIYHTNPAVFASGMVTNPTHERIDSLTFGVLLGYLHHFHPARVSSFFGSSRNRIVIGLLTAILLSVCLFFTHENHFMLTFGFSFIYLGFGGLLLLSLQVRDVLPARLASPVRILGTALAFVGAYSYSIYLWHIPFQAFAPGVLRRLFHVEFDSIAGFWFYLIGSTVFGILMALLIEFPILKVRDRFFPARQAAPMAAPVQPEMPCATVVPSRGS
ncbi:MAG: acyltransferase [Candidatus Acidiferrales bacterium]